MNKLKKEFELLKKQLSEIKFVLQGTISERFVEKENKKTKLKRTLGPYYQWTRKKFGKTGTVNLSKSQLEVYNAAIKENKKLEDIIARLREVSEELLDSTTEGVPKRPKKST